MTPQTFDRANAPDTYDVVEVLTRASSAREALADAVGERVDALDALLVSDVLAAAGRVGETLTVRRELVALCALLRAIDAAERQLIDLDELRDGLAAHAARTDRFERFAEARVLLRTLTELLAHPTAASAEDAVRTQVALLHADLREYLTRQLVGATDGATAQPRTREFRGSEHPGTITDPELARAAHDIVDELRHGADHHPVTGLLGAAWMRGWSAVPVPGEQLGEGDPGEAARLTAAIVDLDFQPRELLLVDLRLPRPWRVHGRTLELRDGLRCALRLPATAKGIAAAIAERTRWCTLTTRDLDFAIVEGAGHHAILGPKAFVTAACGGPPIEAVARFREHVEELAEPGEDPPADLLEVADGFGRLRRRSR